MPDTPAPASPRIVGWSDDGHSVSVQRTPSGGYLVIVYDGPGAAVVQIPEDDWHQLVADANRLRAPAAPGYDGREARAAAFIRASGKQVHSSDCATSVAPAMEPGPCDCDEPQRPGPLTAGE